MILNRERSIWFSSDIKKLSLVDFDRVKALYENDSESNDLGQRPQQIVMLYDYYRFYYDENRIMN